MKLPFRRNKNKEEELEGKDDPKKDPPKRRGRKSKAEKEKEKKEKKPWGKFERYLVLFILISTISISGLLALYSRSWKIPNAPRLKIPEETFEQTFVLGNEDDSPTALGLAQQFSEVTHKLSGVYGYKVIELHSGENSGVFENEVFQAASLIKLPVMSLMFDESEKKWLNLDAKHSLSDDEKVAGSGTLHDEPAGTVVTYRQLIELMGKQSDNTAFKIAVDTLGKDKIEQYIKDIGMRNTNLENNETTPADMAKFFEKLWQGRLLNDRDKSELIGYLTNTAYEDWLAAGVPEGTRVAHKFGRELHVINDAGIVFGDKPYIVVILSKGIVESEANQIFPSLSSLIYNYIN